ncbi:hypothetical protein, partial [Burkholderia mallei]|uniref:hypothetical protein n=1 Tax=Burkholderia mallei TaxID=13373 RepID=UPI001C49DC7E
MTLLSCFIAVFPEFVCCVGWVALPAPARARGTRTARIEADRRRSGRVRRAGAERMPAARLRRT